MKEAQSPIVVNAVCDRALRPSRTDREASERPDRIVRFRSDISVYAELLLDEGRRIEIIEQETTQLLDTFEVRTPREQQELVHDLRKSVNRQLSGRLNTSLSLAHDLQADDEIDSNTLGKNEQVWRVLFANSSSIDRLEIVRSLEKENGEALVRNYDKYLKEWEEVLSGDPTLSPEAVLRKIIAAEQKFKYASTRGKIGLSRTLREVIDTSSTSKFSALLELYEELLRRDAGHGDSLPELEDWIKKYSKGSTTERRELTKKLHISVSALMLSKSAENSTES